MHDCFGSLGDASNGVVARLKRCREGLGDGVLSLIPGRPQITPDALGGGVFQFCDGLCGETAVLALERRDTERVAVVEETIDSPDGLRLEHRFRP